MDGATFFVLVALIIFLGILVYFGVPKAITASLDARADKIKAELEEARRLKDEAQKVLAEYQRKQREAEKEAQAIIAQAKSDAERMAAESKAKLEDFVVRRTKLAEQKIAQAEVQAMADVRSVATEAAVKAAQSILTGSATGKVADDLIAAGIKDVRAKLN
jgi:F-type H+-transporting ATPase subunit b